MQYVNLKLLYILTSYIECNFYRLDNKINNSNNVFILYSALHGTQRRLHFFLYLFDSYSDSIFQNTPMYYWTVRETGERFFISSTHNCKFTCIKVQFTGFRNLLADIEYFFNFIFLNLLSETINCFTYLVRSILYLHRDDRVLAEPPIFSQ